MRRKLTPKQLAYRIARLKTRNKTEAARMAGYKHPNVEAHKVEKNPAVKAAIEADEAVALAHAQITAEKILSELWQVGSLDIRQAFNIDGSLKAIAEMPENIARCIASVDVDELFDGTGPDRTQIGVTKKVRFWPKVPALDLLGRNKKLWDEVSTLSGVPMVINIVPANHLSAPDTGH